MYEYGIYNSITKEERIVFGYSTADAFRRSNLDVNEWKILYSEYVD